jgi:3-dehydroquinate dehydratase-2
MAGTILVLNGPNLNLIGVREPELYGRVSLDDLKERCIAHGHQHGLKIDFRQSNEEGTLIDWLQEATSTTVGVVINPAGYSFHSIALRDALKIYDGPKIEVHITNVDQRELIGHGVTGLIAGLGAYGYELAIDAIAALARADAYAAKA